MPARTDGLQPWRLSFVPPRHLRIPGYIYPEVEESEAQESPATPPRAERPAPPVLAAVPPQPRAAVTRPAHELLAGACGSAFWPKSAFVRRSGAARARAPGCAAPARAPP